MSWYDDAAKEISDDGEIGAEAIAKIIAKHDPNKWVPVSERLPEMNLFVEFIAIGTVWHGQRSFSAWLSGYDSVISSASVTHWRPIVLPEVKG